MRKGQQKNDLSYRTRRGNRQTGNRQAEMHMGEDKGRSG